MTIGSIGNVDIIDSTCGPRTTHTAVLRRKTKQEQHLTLMHGRIQIQDSSPLAVADPGFLRAPNRGANPRGRRQSIIWHNFCRKLYENGKKWTKRGAHVARTFLDPPLLYRMCQPNNLSKISKTPNEIEKFWGVPSSGSGGGADPVK